MVRCWGLLSGELLLRREGSKFSDDKVGNTDMNLQKGMSVNGGLMSYLKGFAIALAVAAVAPEANANEGLPVRGLRPPNPSPIIVMPLTAADRDFAGSGAYCSATNERGQVLFSAADNAVIRVNGRRVSLQMGRAAFSSTIMLAFDKSFWVEFKPRAGRSREGEESTSRPMTMKVGQGDYFVSVPVMRECGA